MVGIGLQSGKIILHNLKFDETVMSFHQEWGPVIGLTFRTGTRLVRPFSQLFLFPIAFPLLIVGDKWLKKWKIGTVIKREKKKEELNEGVWVYEKLLYVLVFYFFLYLACDMIYKLQGWLPYEWFLKNAKSWSSSSLMWCWECFSFLILQKWVSWAMGKNNLRIKLS